MAITTKIAIENYLLTTIDASFQDQLTEWIDAMEQYMNHETRRQLIADASTSEYRYDGSGKYSLMLDDFLTITAVEVYSTIDDTVPDDYTDYITRYPANSTPKWQIKSTHMFPYGQQNIGVTGRRGSYDAASIPSDLKQAATVLVAGIVNFSNVSDGEVKSESIGRWTVTYVTDGQKVDFENAKRTLQHYKKMR